MHRKRNVFIVGLTDFHLHALRSIADFDRYALHPLLGYREVVEEHLLFSELLARARRALAAFDGPIDAIISQWDFPTSCLVPVLCAEHGIPAPSLESVLKCEHKYWARLEQAKVAPECVPRFAVVDPFDRRAVVRPPLPYPFWLKPVKSFSSGLGFRVENRAQFRAALAQTRERIGELGHAFNEVLSRVRLPPEVAGVGGLHCLAEEIMSGEQAAPEGYVFNGEVHIHGLFDMLRDANGMSFSRLQYPCALPAPVQARMGEVAGRVMRRVGFDNGCFNVEFMWEAARQKLWLIEVNTRMSQSHSELFLKVDGVSNHQIAIDLALGRPPRFPHRRGGYPLAAKFWVNHYGDARVRRVPGEDEVETVQRAVPGEPRIAVAVRAGDRLSALTNQDAYRYVIAEIYLGADSEGQLLENYRRCLEGLHFDFDSGAVALGG